MSGLVGSLEAISTNFDAVDPKDIRQGIKECINDESKILAAEKEKIEKEKNEPVQPEIDSVTLTDEIRSDMGDEVRQDNDKQDLER